MYYAMTTEKTSSGNTIVSFEDIPECNTQISGDITTLENRLLIEDAILTALSFYQERKERLPCQIHNRIIMPVWNIEKNGWW